MSDPMTMRRAADLPDPLGIVPDVLPGVHEAGNPYFDYLFGGRERAQAVLTRWMSRATSEVWVSRSTLMYDGESIAGGFIALGGADLTTCRKADTMTLLLQGGRSERAALRERLEPVSDMFAPVEDGDFYLSKMWVDAAHRGKRLGGELMRSYLETGRQMKLARFSLDVSADNAAAIRLYESFGFRVVREKACAEAGMHYLSMTAEPD